MDQYIGKMLDNRYEILEVIGVGGMAVVYKAMCHRLNRLVAIKILKDEYSKDAEFRRRFHGESQAVAMMSHPNIVNVYDVSKSDELDYIVMELIDGITLKQYMERKGVLNWRETLHFSMQIAKALEHAHSRNIIHRDIKPHNIMILKDGSVKVADFGIARVASAQNTLTKEALGSVHYISPEQARGARVDNRTDLYSLGVVMYQMLTGRTPYDGDSPVSVAIQHINGTPLLPSLLNSNIPTGLEQITMHAMCADLNRRYASATDMLRDMEEFRKNPSTLFSFAADGSSVSVKPAAAPANRPRERTAQPPGQPARVTEEDYAREEREARKKQILTIVLIAAGVLVLAGLIILIISQLPKKAEPAAAEQSSQVEELTVPNLLGKTIEEAKLLDYPGISFIINNDSYIYDAAYPEGTICKQSVPGDTKVAPNTEVYLNISLGEQTDTMPSLEGRSLQNAEELLRGMDPELMLGWNVEEIFDDEVREGYVIRTDPQEGALLKKGDKIKIYVSKGPEIKKVKVPDVLRYQQDSAIAALAAVKLKGVVVEEQFSDTVAKGCVISQNPTAGTEVEEDTEVSLVISRGKAIVMPNVMNQDADSAKALLESMGLKVELIGRQDPNASYEVSNQSAAVGEKLEQGATVYLTVTKTPEPTEPSKPDITIPTPPDTGEPEPTEPPADTSENDGNG